MTQQIIIALLCVGALFYLGRVLYKHFTKPGCSDNCGACSKIDFEEIERKAKNQKFISEKPTPSTP